MTAHNRDIISLHLNRIEFWYVFDQSDSRWIMYFFKIILCIFLHIFQFVIDSKPTFKILNNITILMNFNRFLRSGWFNFLHGCLQWIKLTFWQTLDFRQNQFSIRVMIRLITLIYINFLDAHIFSSWDWIRLTLIARENIRVFPIQINFIDI